jgi:hypothetical protein
MYKNELLKEFEGKLPAEEIKKIIDKEFEGIPEDDVKRNQAALNSAIVLIEIKIRESSSHKCVWEMSHENGRFYCRTCGEDGGSPWEC